MQNTNRTRRREPMSDTQLLLTITICIFFGLYILAMVVWGGGFLRPQQVFDMLNNNAALIIVACSLTIVMICGGIDISVGGVISLVVMACVVFLESTGNLFVTILLALGIGLGAALSMCVFPFILPDIAKMALAILVSARLKPLLRRR